MKKELIIVTGGAGFIGSHTVELLLEKGHQVVVLDNFSTGKYENLDEFKDNPDLHIIEADIESMMWPTMRKVESTLGKVDRIVHLAAQTAVISSVEDPLKDINLNYKLTANVLEYAKYTKVKKVIFSSSAAVYGDVKDFPIVEDQICKPVSPYGINKLGSEKYMYYYSKIHQIPTTSLRFFNVYGPKQDPHSQYSGVISIFIERALKHLPITIFGDGEQSRDFIYVKDVARTIVNLLLTPKGSGEVFNVGTNNEITINQLAKTIVDISKSKSPIKHVKARSGEILRSLASVEKLKSFSKNHSRISISKGLLSTIEWIKS